MYMSLGSAKTLLSIRKRDKNKKHCRYLQNDPHACICFSEEIKGASAALQIGELCPNNPFRKESEIFDELNNYSVLLSEIEDLEIAVALGRVLPFDVAPPNQIFVSHLIQQMNTEQGQIAQQTSGIASASAALGGSKSA